MKYIDYSVLEEIEKLRDDLVIKKRNTMATAVNECVKLLKKAVAEREYVPETAERVTRVEPWFFRGATGRDVTRCGVCRKAVRKTDEYCSGCGRKLTGE